MEKLQMNTSGELLEYDLIDISFDIEYEIPDNESAFVKEDESSDKDKMHIEYDERSIPMGRTKPEIKAREKIIKDFYIHWIAEHPKKAIRNKNLNKLIFVKYQSINETYNKAARSYASTLAVFNLTEILENAEFVKEETPKGNKNQKQYEKILIMKYKDVKLIIGLQKSTQEHVQDSITVPTNEGIIKSHPRRNDLYFEARNNFRNYKGCHPFYEFLFDGAKLYFLSE